MLRGDIHRHSHPRNISLEAASPVLCARSVVASLVAPCLAANVSVHVMLVSFASENADAHARVRSTYAAYAPVYERVITRRLRQTDNVVAAMDTAVEHPFVRAADHVMLIRYDVFLKQSLAAHVLPIIDDSFRFHEWTGAEEPRILVAFPSRAPSDHRRPNGSRPSCEIECNPRVRQLCERKHCHRCGAFPGELRCPTASVTPPHANALNDVFFGFLHCGLVGVKGGAVARPGAEGKWWSEHYRNAFLAAAPHTGATVSEHNVGPYLSRFACIAYVVQDAFDANSSRMANPLYEILPRSFRRLERGECEPSKFVRVSLEGPPCCPLQVLASDMNTTRGRRQRLAHCLKWQGIPPRHVRTCQPRLPQLLPQPGVVLSYV